MTLTKIWDPRKHIPLYTTDDFKCKWETIIPEPAPGMLVGTGWLTPEWINKRGHNEKEYQRCIINHWPRTLVPSGISENDKIGDLIPAIIDLIKEGGNALGIDKDLLGAVGNFAHQLLKYFSEGPVKGIPLFNLINPDGSLTFLYANWYEGTPINLHWVIDFNSTRLNRIKNLNEQIHQLEEIIAQIDLHYRNSFPEVPSHQRSDENLLVLPINNSNENGITINNSGQFYGKGQLQSRLQPDGVEKFYLTQPSSGRVMTELKSADLQLERLPEIAEDSIISVYGEKIENSSKEKDVLLPCLYIDQMTIIKSANEIHQPAIVITEEILIPENSFQDSITTFGLVCPTEIRKEISKEAKEIEAAGERLKSIDWKKYGTIAGMVFGLVVATISAAAAVASAATGAGGVIAGALLHAKIMALYRAVSVLSDLEDSAKKDLMIIRKCQDNLKKLEAKHPQCFKATNRFIGLQKILS